MELNTIVEKEENTLMTFRTVIEKRILLKTKLKLIHILAFDEDLRTLEKNGLSLEEIHLEDFKIEEGYHLAVPVSARIIPFMQSLKLKSYLIYLSYLYNIDLVDLQQKEPVFFYRFLFKLNLPENIRRSLFALLSGSDRPYFTSYLEELNSPEFRGILYETRKTLELNQKIVL